MNDELLIKFLLNETSEDENVAVKTWLSATAENAIYFAQMEQIWKISKLPTVDVDEEIAWRKFRVKADALPKKTAIVKPLKRNYNWISIAAVLLIAIGSWSVYTCSDQQLTQISARATKLSPKCCPMDLNLPSISSLKSAMPATLKTIEMCV